MDEVLKADRAAKRAYDAEYALCMSVGMDEDDAIDCAQYAAEFALDHPALWEV